MSSPLPLRVASRRLHCGATPKTWHCNSQCRSIKSSHKPKRAPDNDTKLSNPSPGQTRRTVQVSSPELVKVTADDYKPYTPKDIEELKKKYTPEQVEAILIGEKVIDPKDLAKQASIRQGPMALKYIDDFAKYRSIVDRPEQHKESYPWDPKLKLKSQSDSASDFTEFARGYIKKYEKKFGVIDTGDGEGGAEMSDLDTQGDVRQEQSTDLDYGMFQAAFEDWTDNEQRLTWGNIEAEKNMRSFEAPKLVRQKDPITQKVLFTKRDQQDLDTQYMLKLAKELDMPVAVLRRFRMKEVYHNFVSNQTRLGKVQSSMVVTVVGNEDGMIGLGIGKAEEATNAKSQAFIRAIKSMKPIHRYENRTIYGEVFTRVGGTTVSIHARHPGYGLRTQDIIYEMCMCAGLKDLSARVGRNRNKMNVAKATYEALTSQRLPEDIARGRGKKLVDLRKVYYAGGV